MLKLNSKEKKMRFNYVLSIGSNIEPKLKHLTHALTELTTYGYISKRSSIYKTEPWGRKDQSEFYNAVIIFISRLSPKELLIVIKKIENKMGRVKSLRWGERTIDIDILFADDLVINEVDLKIPHKFLNERKFILVPLAELTEDIYLPHYLKSAKDLLHECTDSSMVEKLALTWE